MCVIELLMLVERQALEDVPNVLATQQVIETEAAAYLVRQWLACSLYDRISTRPFITEMEKLWISYQIIYALNAAQSETLRTAISSVRTCWSRPHSQCM